jgi:hypothetical protein
LTQTVRDRERRENKEGEKAVPMGLLGALGNAAATLKARWKLLLPFWLAISAALVALILLLPEEYQRTFVLSVSASRTELQAEFGQPAPEPTQVGNQAIKFLQQTDFGQVTVSPTYNSPKQQIQVLAQSQDKEALDKAPSRAVAAVQYGFRATYEGTLGPSIQSQLASAQQQENSQQATLKDIEDRISNTKPKGPEDIEAIVKLTVLEGKRQDALNGIASQRDRIKSLQEDLKNLPQLAAEPVAVKVVDASAIRQGNSRAPAAFFAVLLGFVIAAAAVLRFAAARSK